MEIARGCTRIYQEVRTSMKKSRGRSGPKTTAGKNRSRGNSLKHGLAALVLVGDRSLRVEQLTRILINGPFDAETGRLAHEVAIARAELEEVMAARASVLQLNIAAKNSGVKTPEVHTAEGVLHSLERLKSLQRYERRALTRWFRSLDEFQQDFSKKGYSTIGCRSCRTN